MSAETIRIYYNPRCAKCRATSALIAEHGYVVETVEYLVTPPAKEELCALLRKLGMKPEEIVRKSENLFKERYASRTLNDEEWLDVLVANPILIERPIVVRGNKAVVARPPEKVLALL